MQLSPLTARRVLCAAPRTLAALIQALQHQGFRDPAAQRPTPQWWAPRYLAAEPLTAQVDLCAVANCLAALCLPQEQQAPRHQAAQCLLTQPQALHSLSCFQLHQCENSRHLHFDEIIE